MAIRRYPHRDEVIAYLLRYANQLDADIRTGRRVSEVRADGDGFALALEDGSRLTARAVVAATAGFGQPNRPALPSCTLRTTGPRALAQR
ncbi:NAD(P)-binding domain-containing protein [Streptomyces sp. NBC_00154]|uniref:NAD(P)-binding domain-containing protein n=1 Tax=Streptomyces sp. NBC_00154 TaxID=2975670 RepID=UPI00224DD125|nr:NAD(P)-binding domain-containing protein [Streptomyces sp. NBC_00154]MCX5309786.1 NAD(P)-binding domain-containing protein [Streptomyces sp. NBC_00154]